MRCHSHLCSLANLEIWMQMLVSLYVNGIVGSSEAIRRKTNMSEEEASVAN